jgi:nucleotide-binding universal stress UspA family protein
METGVDVDTVLVPIDGSDETETAVEYAIAVADRYDATLHAMYVLGEEASRAIEEDAVDDDELAEEVQSVFAAISDLAASEGVPFAHSITVGFSTTRKLVHPGSAILDAADQIDADFLVIPRETGLEEDDVLEKAAEYVLSYASQPVLSV